MVSQVRRAIFKIELPKAPEPYSNKKSSLTKPAREQDWIAMVVGSIITASISETESGNM